MCISSTCSGLTALATGQFGTVSVFTKQCGEWGLATTCIVECGWITSFHVKTITMLQRSWNPPIMFFSCTFAHLCASPWPHSLYHCYDWLCQDADSLSTLACHYHMSAWLLPYRITITVVPYEASVTSPASDSVWPSHTAAYMLHIMVVLPPCSTKDLCTLPQRWPPLWCRFFMLVPNHGGPLPLLSHIIRSTQHF